MCLSLLLELEFDVHLKFYSFGFFLSFLNSKSKSDQVETQELNNLMI